MIGLSRNNDGIKMKNIFLFFIEEILRKIRIGRNEWIFLNIYRN